MPELKDKLIVALDVDTKEEAKKLLDILYPQVKFFKVGSQLFTACGPDAIKMIIDKGARVFLDLKFHDIPNTVKKAVEAASRLKVYMLNVHLSGGKEMLEAAASVKNRPKILGVTILTSQADKDAKNKVLDLAKIAKDAGLDGVVCSAQEASAVRSSCGKDFVIVTPGIRPKNYKVDDQARVATAKDAVKAGVNFIVVGRPIIQAADPLSVVKEIIQEIAS